MRSRTAFVGLGVLSILAGVPRGVYFEGEGTGGGAGDPPPANTPKTYTEAEFNALSSRLTTLETEHTAAKTKLTEYEQSQLTEQQKVEAKAAEAETARKAAETTAEARAAELKQERLERLVEREAGALKVIDADAALRLLDLDKVEYDDAGKPKNVKELLAALVAEKPYLVGSVGPSAGLIPGTGRSGRGGVPTAIDKINEDFDKRRGTGSSSIRIA